MVGCVVLVWDGGCLYGGVCGVSMGWGVCVVGCVMLVWDGGCLVGCVVLAWDGVFVWWGV